MIVVDTFFTKHIKTTTTLDKPEQSQQTDSSITEPSLNDVFDQSRTSVIKYGVINITEVNVAIINSGIGTIVEFKTKEGNQCFMYRNGISCKW